MKTILAQQISVDMYELVKLFSSTTHHVLR